jgi:predicted dehydrogenase
MIIIRCFLLIPHPELLDDPNIDAIYVPLPNAYHYEWAVRSIRAGKHVLIEKPSVSNAEEAERLFHMPELSQPNAPVVLEAFHVRFYPSWQLFKTLVNPADIEHIHAKTMIPWWMTSKDQIFLNYDLSGGAGMSMGTYNIAALRDFTASEAVECTSCEVQTYPDEHLKRADTHFKATYLFPNGATGIAETTLLGPTIWEPSSVKIDNKEVVVPDNTLPQGQVKYVKRHMELHGILFAVLWHRIDIKDTFTIRTTGGKVVKTWTESSSRKAYTFKEAGGKFADLPGESGWISYRHMLEQFVNKIKGRPTQYFVEGEDSIAQMKMVDMAYEKSGLGIRPTKKTDV